LILQALYEHYQRLLGDPESGIAPPGFSLVEISFVLVLSLEGQLVDMFPVKVDELVPEHKKRQGINPPPYFLCDKVQYSLGVGKNIEQGIKRYEQYRDYNLKLLEKATNIEAQAVKKFMIDWKPMHWESEPCVRKYLTEFNKPITLNTVYKIDGMNSFVHHNPEIIALWEQESQEGEARGFIAQCLITGQTEVIAKTHEVGISGIGEKANAAIVSFNCDSFESYGKAQSYNAPVSKKAAFAYSTALNYLVASDTNRVRLADTTVVFWADKNGGRKEEAILAWCLDPVEFKDGDELVAARQAKTILERVRVGQPVGDGEFDRDTRCYILGLAPNAARLSVRFWQVSNFGGVLERIVQHYEDMNIQGIDRIGGFVSPWQTLRAVAIQEDSKNVPPLLGGQFLNAILSGHMYPQTLYNLTLNRCRTGGDYGGVSTIKGIIRAAVVKAFLQRKYRMQGRKHEEAMITVSLNEDNSNSAYQLGRLFSLLEKAQKDALGNQINATIRDRYFGAASATPGSVFPLLLRLSQHHLSKSEYGASMDRRIQDVLIKLDAFPGYLNLEEQGQFILGYYHQNQANYTKNNSDNEEKEG